MITNRVSARTMNISEDCLKFKTPFTCMIAGPTGSGKTVLVRRILKNHNLLITGDIVNSTKILRVIWAYGQWQQSYENAVENVSIQYVEGLPSEEEIMANKPDLIVIDDLMTELGNNKKLADLFTKGSHHHNLNVMFLSQNLFHQGSQMRTIGLNCHYIILLKNPRDNKQVTYLGGQIYPSKHKFFLDAYEQATARPFGYIKINLTQTCPERFRLTSRITPEEVPPELAHLEVAPILYLEK